jgi:hypothetical protein
MSSGVALKNIRRYQTIGSDLVLFLCGRALVRCFNDNLKEDIMNVRRFLAPFVCALFGLYCVIWGIVSFSSLPAMRAGAAFFGILFLLLATVYVRMILPHEQAEHQMSDMR